MKKRLAVQGVFFIKRIENPDKKFIFAAKFFVQD